MRVRKATLTFAAIYFAGLALAAAGPHFLPADYYFDSATLRDTLADATAPIMGDSYNNTALLYRWLGFGTLLPDALAGPLGYTAAFAAAVSASRLASSRWVPWLYAAFALWNIPLAIFDGTYSKEVPALLVVSAVCALARSGRGVLAAAALGLAYAVTFRSYWGIVVALWLTVLGVWRLGGGWPLRMTAAFVAVLVMSAAARGFAGIRLSDARTAVMDARELIAFSATQFANFVPNSSPLTDLINIAIGWVMLFIPAFLLSRGGPQHIAFAAFQFASTALFALAAWRMRPLRKPATRSDWRIASAVSFCIAFSIVQGMFEPDYGSFAKHETVLLPMLFYVLAQAFGRRLPAPVAPPLAAPVASDG